MKKYTIDFAINGRHLEMEAKAQILPGMLLERYEDGVRPHSVTEGIAPPLIAIENRFMGTDIHTPYETGDTVYIRYCLPGDIAWLWFLPVAGCVGSNASPLPFVVSSGDGLVKLALLEELSTDHALVGQYLEEIEINEQSLVRVEF